MKLKSVLTKNGFSPTVVDIYGKTGITDLFPPQAQAIEKGLLEQKSLLMSVPTAAGKTLMAELCMLKSILHHGGRCLYIAPLKALASEKYEEFKEKFSPLGISVGMAVGDFDSPLPKSLKTYQILIATAEKVDSLLRQKAKSLVNALTVVVIDEIHFINDGSRGPTLEILTARIKQINPSIQFLALSATVSNAEEMAGWLDAELVKSDWRPIPLKEGVYFNNAIEFEGHGSRIVSEDVKDDLSKLTLDTLRGKGQVLVFVNSRRSAQAASRYISKAVDMTLSDEEKKSLKKLAQDILGPRSSSTKICHKLAEVIVHGSAFHHAGLKPNQRKLIEDFYKKNIIKAICSTPTLAAGVNLPARRAIIRDCKRFESGLGMSFIPTSEYKQCAGRAGRPQYDDYGEAVMMAKSFSETQALFDRYILADPEPVISKLANEAALRMHILASISSGYVHDIKGMFDFISHTFLSYQKRAPNLFGLVTDIFDFLHREGFVEKNGFRFYATPFGQSTSRLYIDPLTSLVLRDGLKIANDFKLKNPIGILHLICCCPDSPLLNLGKNDYNDLEEFIGKYDQEFVYTAEDTEVFDDLSFYYSTIKTTWLIMSWIEEERDELICEQFNVGPGDIYRHIESTQWLLYTAGVITDLFDYKELPFAIKNIRNRVRYGIKEELLDLTQIRGVGRIRARNLYNHGFRKMGDLKLSTAEDIGKIEQIGKALAKDIMEQVNKPFIRKKRASYPAAS